MLSGVSWKCSCVYARRYRYGCSREKSKILLSGLLSLLSRFLSLAETRLPHAVKSEWAIGPFDNR